jgi:glycosyltransferase involved in cell wall biosynthesis
MNKPQFSILIPTRDRAVTLRRTLETVVDQTGSFEVLVADNASGPAVKVVIDEFAARYPNVRYLRSDSVLPMAENWERGVAACGGDYVTVLGDDDGLVPTALPCVAKLVAATRSEVVSWATHTYWWPDTIVYWMANRLYVTLTQNRAAMQDSRWVLKAFYAGHIDFGSLPMIYNAFVHRGLIDRAIARRGRYFYPADMAPDISSGILNLLETEKFAHSDRPLAVRGNSRNSTGTAQWARHLGAERRAAYRREEGTTIEETTHPDLIASQNLHIVVANVKLQCKRHYFPDDPELVVDPKLVLEHLVGQLNAEPEAYEENLADAHALAAKLGVDIAARVPAKQPVIRQLFQGPYGGASGFSGVCVNGDLAGIDHIADAVRFADAMNPPADKFLA